jgi:hypothetical protein
MSEAYAINNLNGGSILSNILSSIHGGTGCTWTKTLYDSDLAPITLDGFFSNGRFLRFASPLVLKPVRNAAGDLLVVEYPPYSLHIYAENRALLQEELTQTFEMMWQVFVLEGDRKLTPKAARLKQKLQENLLTEGAADCGTQ